MSKCSQGDFTATVDLCVKLQSPTSVSLCRRVREKQNQTPACKQALGILSDSRRWSQEARVTMWRIKRVGTRPSLPCRSGTAARSARVPLGSSQHQWPHQVCVSSVFLALIQACAKPWDREVADRTKQPLLAFSRLLLACKGLSSGCKFNLHFSPKEQAQPVMAVRNHTQPGVVVHTCNPSTWEVGDRGSSFTTYGFEIGLLYPKPCLNSAYLHLPKRATCSYELFSYIVEDLTALSANITTHLQPQNLQ